MRSAWISAVVLPVSRAISPGCGVRMRMRPRGREAPPTSASASSTIGPCERLGQRAAPAPRSAARAQPGPDRDHGLALRQRLQVGVERDAARFGFGSGSVISSGACDAISAIALRPTPPSPAPRRRAAPPSRPSPPRPVLPRDPPTTSTCPKVPLCPRGRARRKQSAEHRRLDQREPRVRIQLGRAADRAHHQLAHVVAVRRHHLRRLSGAVKVTV